MNYVKEFVKKFNMELDPKDKDAKQKFIDNSWIFIREEFEELIQAIEDEDIEEIIDALGDISWLCEKGLIIAGVNPDKVRQEIGQANMGKEIGVKPGREHAKLDVIKPKGWVGPNHEDNWGRLKEIFYGPDN